MRKLKHVTDGDIAFIKKVIYSTRKRKEDDGFPKNQTYKARCKSVVDTHKDYIEKYDEAFANNKLESLEGTHPVLGKKTKDDIQSLYSYSRKDIADLRHRVLTEDNYEIALCPLCGISLANTLDHFIPQTDYPLFAVHPRNLIPSCTTCNGHKSDNITDKTGKRKFWNVYLDNPPKEEYLFCDVIERKGMPWVKFRIEQGKIDDETFRLIQNTMSEDGQKMLSVYESAQSEYLQHLVNICIDYIRKNADKHSLGDCFKIVKEILEYGFTPNKCEDVMKIALLESTIFQMYVETKLKELNITYRK